MDDAKKSFIEHASAQIQAAASSRPTLERVPYAGVVFDEAEIKNALGALYDAFVTGWFSAGKSAAEFESRFSRYLGSKYCVLTNSGSSANLLAVAALVHLGYLRRGDEVLTPATTFPTTVNPLLLYGLKPVLVDVELQSYVITASRLRRAASARTRGVMLPHLYGTASYMPEIVELARRKKWVVIEDSCDALGTKINGRFTGTFGNVATFSFYGAHHICMGEGGAVVSGDSEIADAVRSIRDWGRAVGEEVYDMNKGRMIKRVGKGSHLPADYEARYAYVTKGFNLKTIDIQPAIGLAQLDKLDAFCESRRRNYAFLSRRLSKHEESLMLPKTTRDVDPSWFAFPIVIRENAAFSRKDLVDHLETEKIETRPILAGNILNQPAYSRREFRVPFKLRNSDLILSNGLMVGLYPGLTEGKLRMMVDAFDSFFESRHVRG